MKVLCHFGQDAWVEPEGKFKFGSNNRHIYGTKAKCNIDHSGPKVWEERRRGESGTSIDRSIGQVEGNYLVQVIVVVIL